MSTESPQARAATGVLSARSLCVGYAGQALLPPIDLDLGAGRVTAILGRNGAGKSTLIKTLLGTLKPISGTIRRLKTPLKIALMPQTRELDFQLPITVREFASWGSLSGRGCLCRPWSTRGEGALVDRVLGELGLGELGGRFLRELSEGQQQRVLFARVLATQADLALLDEPTAAMDAVFQAEVMARLGQMARERSMAVVVVTHALGALGGAVDDIALLDADAGKVVVGPRDEVLRSETFARRFGSLLPPPPEVSAPHSSAQEEARHG